MADKTFLNWPFFESKHQAFAQELLAWAEKNLANIREEDFEDELQAARHFVTLIGKAGWLKNSVPAPYGGASEKLDVRTLCLARDVLARFSGLAEFSFAMQGLGCGPISLFGNEAQKKAYLPKVASGEWIPAFALSEAEAGSDPSALTLSALREGNYFILNGEKTWISNAGIADLYVVFVRTGEAEGAKGLSALIVTADLPGFSVVEQQSIIAPHPIGTLSFNDCRVPVENLIGKPGDGFKIAMATLDVFRSTVGAAAVGFARRALDEVLVQVQERKLFGQSLADFQMTQASVAEMATLIDSSALLVYRAAWAKDQGAERVTREAAMAKMQATEAAQIVIDKAVQLFGAKGVEKGSVVERLYRDIRPLRIYEGATEIQKIVISRETYKQSS